MAKKTKRVSKKTQARKVEKKVLKVEKKVVQPVTAIHLLGITGGIITLLAGILWLLGSLLSWKLEAFTWWNLGDLGIINIVCGFVLLVVAATLKKNFLATGLTLLVFSIIALFIPPAGFVVGPVLAIIGAIIALVRAASPTSA
ncbi:MAG: hypothetical protein QXQ82_01890 [Candidatus Pacearchaeota archaeon]